MKLGLFFGLVTFVLLLAYGTDLWLAFVLLVPATFLLAIVTLSVFEAILLPLYKWLVK
jgi:hypothetical protein